MIYCFRVGREPQRSKVKSDGFSSSHMQMCLSELGKLLTGGELSAGFLLHLLYFSLPTSAASDHYLIGNNITVAVLGIVIPIGE